MKANEPRAATTHPRRFIRVVCSTGLMVSMLLCIVDEDRASPVADREIDVLGREVSVMPQNVLVRGQSRIALDVEVSPPTVALGDRLLVRMVLSNVGATPITVQDRPDGREISIHVLDARSRRVARTRKGDRTLQPEGPDDYSAKLRTLAPGDSHSWERDLDSCFHLGAGRLTAQVSVDVLVPRGNSAEYVPVRGEVSFDVREP